MDSLETLRKGHGMLVWLPTVAVSDEVTQNRYLLSSLWFVRAVQ